jgi:hypothetical protein
METALMSIKLKLSKIPLTAEVEKVKKWLKDSINTFIDDKI